jgi:hypothetical protein
MRRQAIFCLLAALAISGVYKNSVPLRIRESGVEVVVNGPAPYAVPGQPHSLSLREEFRIDLEDAALADAGLTDVATIDADSKGRIYLFRRGGSQGRVIFQFGDHGKLLKSFGTIGQGPGELMYPHFMRITAADEIPVYSQGAKRIVFLDSAGGLLRSTAVPHEHHFIQNPFRLLANGNYLGFYLLVDEQQRVSKIALALFDSRLKKIRDIQSYDLPDRPETAKIPFERVPLVGVSEHAFFANSAPSAKDVAVYDLNGQLIRLIRAPFSAVPVPANHKKAILDRIPNVKSYEDLRKILGNIETYPSFQALFADDCGRIFVSGFEKDQVSGANLCDVFSPDGIRILRTSLGFHEFMLLLSEAQTFDVVIKKDRCYCLREKEDGFKEVVVYSMIWR